MNPEAVNIAKYGFSVLQIETMSTCDMKCRFCVYPIRSDRGQVLPEEKVLQLIDVLDIDKAFEYITFSQFNEPLLDKRLFAFIKHAKNRNLPVLIITNGLLFHSRDIIHKLIDANPDCIKVSLQTLSPQIFNDARGIDYSFQKYKDGVFEFLSVARSASPEVSLDIACNFLCGSKKVKSLLLGLERGDPSVYNTVNHLRTDLKRFLTELKEYTGKFDFDVDAVDAYLNAVSPEYSEEKGFRIAPNISVKVKEFLYGRRLTEFFPVKRYRGCQSRILGILASGSVVPCCLAYEDMVSMGNVRNGSLKSILEKNIGMLTKLRKGTHLHPACQRCLGAPTRRGAWLRQIKNETYNQWFKKEVRIPVK